MVAKEASLLRKVASMHASRITLKWIQQKAGVIMQTNSVTRLFGGIFKLLLTLSILFAVPLLLVSALIRLMRHDKGLRTKLFNLYNVVIRPLAGKRFSPYGLLRHVGRRSGRGYVTPLVVLPFGDGFVLTLSYGSNVDWCHNLMTNGKGVLTWKGQEYALERPEILPISEAWPAYPLSTKLVIRAAGVKQCLWMHKQCEVPERDRVLV
jgi:deazaflavin-dependent oxidoreductase (nitroreductase family)